MSESIQLTPAPDGDPLLVVDDVRGAFRTDAGQQPVLHGVSFSVLSGSMTAIVGESGSGKTLTALSILGLAPERFQRTGGRIVYRGDDLAALPPAKLRRYRGSEIAMVFQDARTALNPVFTVGRQISDVCRLHAGVSRREADRLAIELLERVRVPEAARRLRQYPHEFSGGMAQRAQLAMALACNPRLLLLDEPTTGLDVTIQADILDLIVVLRSERGMTALLITHDLGLVAESCDSVVVMRDGRVRETGGCEQILTRPEDSYTRELLAASTLAEIVS